MPYAGKYRVHVVRSLFFGLYFALRLYFWDRIFQLPLELVDLLVNDDPETCLLCRTASRILYF